MNYFTEHEKKYFAMREITNSSKYSFVASSLLIPSTQGIPYFIHAHENRDNVNESSIIESSRK